MALITVISGRYVKLEYAVLAALMLVATIFLSWDITRPFVDYDEATYAKVVVDTLQSGNIMVFQKEDQNWYEKPPLYLWLAMISVSVFGESEVAFRVPSIIASIICCWLVFLLVREIGGSVQAAIVGFLVLLFSISFYVYAKEMRMDSAVIACMLASLLFLLKARDNKKYLFWVLPFIGIGVLFKSVIALLVLPILIAYGYFYADLRFLVNKYMVWGGLLSAVLVIPWHLYLVLLHGETFWNNYFGFHIVERIFTTVTGTNNYWDYFEIFWPWHAPWNVVVFVQIVALVVICKMRKISVTTIVRDTILPLSVAVWIFVLFTFVKTHLGTYVMPAFPFFALSIAMGFHHLISLFREQAEVRVVVRGLMALCVIGAAIFCIKYISVKVPPYTYDEREIGRIYKDRDVQGAALYALDWRVLETLSYYSGIKAQGINPATIGGETFNGPFFIAVPHAGVSYFFNTLEDPKYPGLEFLFQGNRFSLIYVPETIQMPYFLVVR